jgi:glycosyltransferase involved in cell wall biosynthesis
MRIGLVYRHFNLTGSLQRYTVELARYLSRRDHEVHVFSIASTTLESLAPGCTFHPVPAKHVQHGVWSVRELWSFASAAARQVAREPLDVVHARLPSTWEADVLHLAGVTRGEARRGGADTARWRLAQARHPHNIVRPWLERRAVRNPRVIRFHVDSTQVREDLVRVHGVERDRIRVVPPGVNTDEFRPAVDRASVRAALDLPRDRPLVLFCGHDFRRKGLDRALQALAAVELPTLLMVVGGRAAELPEYERLAAELAVADHVRFIGPTTEAAAYFQAADVCVLPTRVDMWGTTAVEAMASGVPPIVSEAAGSAEVIEDGVSGYVLSEPFELDRFVMLLDRLLRSPELRADLGRAGRARAVELGWDRHGKLVEDDLVSVAANRRVPR